MKIRFGIRNRLFFLTGIMLVFMGIVVAFFVYQADGTKENMISTVGDIMNEDSRDKIMVATQNMATALGVAIQDAGSGDERVAIIRKLINDIRFEADQSGYFFVYRGTVNVILPPKASTEGKDLADTKDVNGIFFVRELQKQAQAGGGFVDYVFAKPGKGDQPKVGYAVMIPGTDMWIGTGVYLDNIADAQAAVAADLEDRVIPFPDHRPVLHRRGFRLPHPASDHLPHPLHHRAAEPHDRHAQGHRRG